MSKLSSDTRPRRETMLGFQPPAIGDEEITAVTETGNVVVRRVPGGYRDLLGGYRLEVDGVEAGRIRRGEQLELPVLAGRHGVRAAIDWTGSPVVEVEVLAGGRSR